jgi:hypothetical protein
VVYPWPVQIKHGDLDSLQVRFWRRLAREHGLTFIDLFPKFVLADEPPLVTQVKYLIAGDVHGNVDGHRRVAESLLPYLK